MLLISVSAAAGSYHCRWGLHRSITRVRWPSMGSHLNVPRHLLICGRWTGRTNCTCNYFWRALTAAAILTAISCALVDESAIPKTWHLRRREMHARQTHDVGILSRVSCLGGLRSVGIEHVENNVFWAVKRAVTGNYSCRQASHVKQTYHVHANSRTEYGQ
jgi:hypothetical protein